MENVDVSVIVPVYNGELWLNDCMESIRSQTASASLNLEISVFDDASTDKTWELLQKWEYVFNNETKIIFTASRNTGHSEGVGFAKNRAIEQSSGTFLCFQDVDDIMKPDRIMEQYKVAKIHQDSLIGCQFERLPRNSTTRFTQWANSINEQQLELQIYTSHGPTIIMPTWFCHRQIYIRVGGFCESGRGTPEDLLFFYKHLDYGGHIYKVPRILLTYRYHENATTFTVTKHTIWDIRVQRLQENILSKWQTFTVWNAGKQGRHLYRSLNHNNQSKVVAFCDIDVKKIGKFYVPYRRGMHTNKRLIPIIHFKNAKPPLVICVKMDLTEGKFEDNLQSLNLQEGEDYVLFS